MTEIPGTPPTNQSEEGHTLCKPTPPNFAYKHSSSKSSGIAALLIMSHPVALFSLLSPATDFSWLQTLVSLGIDWAHELGFDNKARLPSVRGRSPSAQTHPACTPSPSHSKLRSRSQASTWHCHCRIPGTETKKWRF